ncbi:MAG: putative hemolysin [Mariniblastus sp.]|jgi:putative hemolysin
MMLLMTIGLLLIGVFLSAFFSGSETGFYRASRVRVVIAGLDGDRVSQYLIKLINNPTLFVATTLIGNNVANYLTSLAIVLLTQHITTSSAAEMLAPILMSPLLFVYGELLPKNLFYRAPNYLLRVSAPLFLFFTCLLSPVAAVLWGMGRLLEQCLGQSPEKIRLTLARKELQQVLEDGLEAGILHPTQRHLGQSFFLVASKEIGEICTPLGRVKSLSVDATREAVMKFARQKRIADIPVYRTSRSELVGYVRTVDLMVNDSSSLADLMRPLSVVKMTELFGETILQMQSSRETLVSVANSHGKIVGLLSIDQLTDPLLNGPLGSLKR